MEFDKVIEARRSIRKYKPDAVPEAAVRAMVEAVRLAPSGLNVQPWRFVVVRDEATRAALAGAAPSRFVGDAPVVIVCCVDREAFSTVDERYAALLSDPAVVAKQLTISASIAATYLLLKAADLGLGCCWVGVFDEEKVKAITGIERRYEVKALLPMGYPAEQPMPRPRLAVEELILKEIG